MLVGPLLLAAVLVMENSSREKEILVNKNRLCWSVDR